MEWEGSEGVGSILLKDGMGRGGKQKIREGENIRRRGEGKERGRAMPITNCSRASHC